MTMTMIMKTPVVSALIRIQWRSALTIFRVHLQSIFLLWQKRRSPWEERKRRNNNDITDRTTNRYVSSRFSPSRKTSTFTGRTDAWRDARRVGFRNRLHAMQTYICMCIYMSISVFTRSEATRRSLPSMIQQRSITPCRPVVSNVALVPVRMDDFDNFELPLSIIYYHTTCVRRVELERIEITTLDRA